MDTGDTAWVLVASALVLFMTPGLALFYGGMVRSKNVLGMLMQNFFTMGIGAVAWSLLCFSLAFGGDGGGVIGNFDFAFLHGLQGQVWAGTTLPAPAFFAFQMTFAVITPALITGAIADRMRFAAWAWFVPLWLVIVYSPIAKWVFGGGWLAERGALDFAGGAVVHVNAGAAALAAVLVLGRRTGWPRVAMPPHSLPLTLLGTGILWFGWFGFNAGSALAADGIAAQAFVNTFLAASAGMLGWLGAERLREGNATTLGAASGAVGGLVAITPCAGFVGGVAPLVIGALAGVVCQLAVSLKFRFGYDDSLDVIGVHLVGGLLGSLLLGLFADTAANAAGADGLFFGGGLGLLGEQALASAVTFVWSFAATWAIVKVLAVALPGGIRVAQDEEEVGLDLALHSETAYSFADRL